MPSPTLSPEAARLQEQLDQVTSSTKGLAALVARALRLRANGEEPASLHAEIRVAVAEVLALLPETQTPEQLQFSPLELMEQYWEFQANRRELAGTGFGILDKALSGGLERDRLYVILGAPGSGKTTLTNQICDHVGRERAVFYVTSEDSPMTLLCKTIAHRGEIPYAAVQRGFPSERERIEAAFTEYRAQPQSQLICYADATRGLPLADIASRAHTHFTASANLTNGDPVLVIDYLQRLARAEDHALRQSSHAGLGNDARQIATVYTERLRKLACELHCSIICLSAVSRSSGYGGSNNLLGAAKESGDIEYTADMVMGIGPDPNGSKLNGPFAYDWQLRVDKNRQGSTTEDGKHLPLYWYPAFQKFAEREVSADLDGDAEEAAPKNQRYGRRKSS